MSLKFLASLIIFIVFVYTIIIVAWSSRRQRAIAEQKEQEFWDREKRANSVRKKSLDGLDYVKIPLDKLPMNVLPDNEKAREYEELITY